MKNKLLPLAIVALLLTAATGRAQDDVVGESIYQLTSMWSDVASGLFNPPVGPCYAEDISCDNGNCGNCCSCCRKYDIFGSVEYLMWWAKGTNLPPLVTTSDPGTPQVDAGVLNLPTTQILFGQQYGGQEIQAGGRATLGVWLDPDHDVAAGGRFFGLGGNSTRYNASSDGSNILARPFYNAFLDVDDSLLLGFPGLVAGSISATAQTQNIFGMEAFMEIMMLRECCQRVDLVFGYQFMRLDDSLQIVSNHSIIQAGPALGTAFNISDSFKAYNEFHGGQVGLRARTARGCWSIDALGQLAVGGIRQQVIIDGQTTITPAGGAPGTNVGGLLAQPSNIGNYERSKFTFIPQLTVNLKYHVHPCLNFFVGYNLIWINDVATSGDQVDLRVNLNQPVGPALPAFAFRDRDYWLQGMNFGGSWDF
jgi:hypothetical protein